MIKKRNYIRKNDIGIQVPDYPMIPFIEGDGSGRDIWNASRKVIDSAIAVAYKGKKRIEWFELLAGEKAFQMTGDWLPTGTIESFRNSLVGIKGPLTTPVGEGFRSLNVALRRELDLYVCLRPIKWYSGVPSPVHHPELLNVVIFRENTEDVYAGIEFEAETSHANELLNFLKKSNQIDTANIRFPATSAFSIKPISKEGSSRLVRAAIQYALKNDRKKVTLVHKGNIMKFTEGGFREWGYQLAESEFQEQVYTHRQVDRQLMVEGEKAGEQFIKTNSHKVFINDVIADAAFEIALTRPGDFDVLATTNLNGDYLSDALAAQVGGLGIAPGANINPETGVAIFEATHGTAPLLAGKDQANPCSLLLSGVLMLRYIGWKEAADLIENAIQKTLREGYVTQDFARAMHRKKPLSTPGFADKIIENIEVSYGGH